jgi:beta-lactamase class A
MITDQPTAVQLATLPSQAQARVDKTPKKDRNAAVNLVLRQGVEQAIELSESKSVVTSVYLQDLKSGAVLVDHDTSAEHFGASIQKVPFAYLALQDLRAGKIKLTDTVSWTADDVRGGAGFYDQPGSPTTAKVQDLLWDMLHRSGNTSARIMVKNVLGGATTVNQRFAADPNLAQTYTQLVTPDGSRFYFGYTNTKNALYAFNQIVGTPKDKYQKLVFDAMRTNTWDDMGVRSQIDYQPNLTLVNKIGLLDDPEANNRHDIGIISDKKTKREYLYAVMTSSPYEDTITGDATLRSIGRSLVQATTESKKQAKTTEDDAKEIRQFNAEVDARGFNQKSEQ